MFNKTIRRKEIIITAVVLIFVALGFLSNTERQKTNGNAIEFVAEEASAGFTYPYPPREVLYFNPNLDSGWTYISQTAPVENKTFWVALVRSLSTEATDKSAHLLYGISDLKTGKYYSNVLPGEFSESPNKIDVSFRQNSQELVSFKQTSVKKERLDNFSLKINLPCPLVKNGVYQLKRALNFREPILYESGDGKIPMGSGLESLYVSLAPLGKDVWVDFQKFNIKGTQSISESLDDVTSSRFSGPNHRWGSFILNKPVGKLPKGTIGVYWEILDSRGKRQPEGFTNIDLLIPGKQQKTSVDFEIKEIDCWESEHKTYLRKWRLAQNELGVDLGFETAIIDQESKVELPGLPPVYFYEGAVKVSDSRLKTQVGSGMLEQTHNEADDEIKCSKCVKAGDPAMPPYNCCPGLKLVSDCLPGKPCPISLKYCVDCGNKSCDPHENRYNCLMDCFSSPRVEEPSGL